MLVSRAKFAKLAGVCDATVKNNVDNGYLIIDRKINKMDTDNPKNKAYLEKRISLKDKQDIPNRTNQFSKPQSKTDDTINQYATMVEQEQKFKVEKLKMDIKVKELLLREKRGDLISKQRIADVCFGYLDALNKNMLVMPQVFIDRVENFIKTNSKDSTAKKELMNEITGYITKSIQNTKHQVVDKINDQSTIEEVYNDEE